MNKFAHLKWYEIAVYMLFSFYCLVIITNGIASYDNFPDSPLIPAYAIFLSMAPYFMKAFFALLSILGILYVVIKKKGGWSLLFIGSLSLIFSSFMPFHTLEFVFGDDWNFLLLIFLLVPLILFLKKTDPMYNISPLNFKIALMTVFIILILWFFSFDIYFCFACGKIPFNNHNFFQRAVTLRATV